MDVLDSPVDVAGDPNEPWNYTEVDIKRITLVVYDFKAHPLQPLIGRRVEVRGTLFHAHTGHHHTRVLIQVTSIKKLENARSHTGPTSVN